MSLASDLRPQNEVVVVMSQGRLVYSVLGSHVPELRALELLVEVARTGSLSAAADLLGITQQAASSRIRTMESLIGAPLLVRTRRGSALTPTGDLVVQWAGRVLEEAAQLDAGIAALRSDRRGHLRIAASLTIAEHLLPGLAGRRTRRPGPGRARADRLHDDRDQQRARRRARHGRRGRPGLRGGTRRARRPAPPAGRTRRARGRGRARRTSGRSAHGAGSRPAPSRPRRWWCARPAPAPAPCSSARSADLPVAAPVLELSSTAAVRAAVAAGAGPAVLGAHAVRDDLATGRLVAITVTGLDLTRRLNAVWRDGAQPPAGPARELVARAVRSAPGPLTRPVRRWCRRLLGC